MVKVYVKVTSCVPYVFENGNTTEYPRIEVMGSIREGQLKQLAREYNNLQVRNAEIIITDLVRKNKEYYVDENALQPIED